MRGEAGMVSATGANLIRKNFMTQFLAIMVRAQPLLIPDNQGLYDRFLQ